MEPQKGTHFMAAALPRNNLKIYNFGTPNGIKIKLTTIMYHHKTFNLQQKLGRQPYVIRERDRKTSEKKLKKRFFGFFSPPFFRIIYKLLLHMIPCLALHHWSKF